MIYDDIKNFHKQFTYEPKVENVKALEKLRRSANKGRRSGSRRPWPSEFLVAGMGGSRLAGDILKAWQPQLDILIWSDYGLPPLSRKDLKERLTVASSYSGNTEETIDVFWTAKKHGFPLAVVAAGGKLINLARKNNVPYVLMPDLHIQPRMALGLTVKAILCLTGEKAALTEISELSKELQPFRHESSGKTLAKRLYGSIPVVYTSLRNYAVAYNWKIKFNETGKIPAFWNVLPELNHNEMTGFDVKPRTLGLSKHFHFVFLKDIEDERRIVRRMNILEKLYHDRGFKVEAIFLQGANRIHKIFSSLNLADWTAYYTAEMYGVEPEQVPMVEEFKRLVGRK